jgi:hypothetical protein
MNALLQNPNKQIANKTSAEIAAFNASNAAAIEAGLLLEQVQSASAAADEAKQAACAAEKAKQQDAQAKRDQRLHSIVIAAGGTAGFALSAYYAKSTSYYRNGALKGYRLTWGFEGGANFPLSADGDINWKKVEAKVCEVLEENRAVAAAKAAAAAKLAAGSEALGEILTAYNKTHSSNCKAEANADGTFRLFSDHFVENFRRAGGCWVQNTVYRAISAEQIAALTAAKRTYAAACAAILAK